MSWFENFLSGLTKLFGGNDSIERAEQFKYKKREMALGQDYAERSMRLQADLQKEQWDRENAYNDPRAVASRYKAAGISPQGVLGGASSGAGLSSHSTVGAGSGAPSSSGYYANSRAENLMSIASGLSEMRNMAADRKNTMADTENKRLDNKIKEQELIAKRNQNSLFEFESRIASSNADAAEYVAKLQQIRSDFEQAIQEQDMELRNALILERKETIEKMRSEGFLNRYQARYYMKKATEVDSNVALNQSQIKVNESQVGVNNAKIGEIQSQQSLNEANVQVAYANTRKILADADHRERENFYYDDILQLDIAKRSEEIANLKKDRELIETRTRELEAEINRLDVLNSLTEEQKRQIKNDIARSWAEFGVDSSVKVADEVLRYLTFGLSGSTTTVTKNGNTTISTTHRTR